jgi:hypothetical protein
LLDPKRTQEFGGECLQPRATCDAFFLDMDGDGREEVLLGDRNRLRLWSLGADGRWSQQGWLQLNCITADALWRGEAKVVPPRYNDLEGGGRRARLDFDFWRDQPDPKDCPKR